MKKLKGFTLIEIIIVITIIGVLAALISSNFLNSLKKGRDAKRKADLEQMTRALEMYYEDNKVYPDAVSFGGQLCHPGGCATKIYMQKLPNDPVSGKTYSYRLDNESYRLYACLENSQQVLPYNTLIQTPSVGWTCSMQCKMNNGGDTTDGCIWAV